MSTAICSACGASVEDGVDPCPKCKGAVRLCDRYRLIEIVGQGAVGTTYQAVDLTTDTTVAVKEMPLHRGQVAAMQKRFEREARVLRQLHHPGIPEYIDHFLVGEGKQRSFYIVQRFIAGRTLAAEMDRRRYTELEIIEIADAILEILEYLHGLAPPVVHRDIKPGNIVRCQDDDRLVLIDFGSVRDVLQDPKLGGSTVAGTFGYMAPEQFRGDAYPASDVYAVGVLMVVLLSRKDPMDLMAPDHTLRWKSELAARPETVAFIERLLAVDREARPANGSEARAELTARNKPPDAPPAPVPVPVRPSLVAAQRTLRAPIPVRVSRDMRRRLGARNKFTAVMLAFLGGFVGLHFWYLGRFAAGVLSFLFFWTLVPWAISTIDAFRLAFMSRGDFDARFNPAIAELEQGRVQDLVEQIGKLHALMQEGALTAEEFEHEKARLLGTHESIGRALGHDGFQSLWGRMQEQIANGVGRKLDKHTSSLAELRRLPQLILEEMAGAQDRRRRQRRMRHGRPPRKLR